MNKKMLAMVACTLCASLAVGCSSAPANAPVKEGQPVDKVEEQKPEETEEVGGVVLPETLANGDITILWHTSEEAYKTNLEKNPEAFDPVWSVLPEFEKKYGGKVNVIATGWGEMKDNLIGMVNAGEVCDLAQANDQTFPLYPMKKLVQPLEAYFDVNNEMWNPSITDAYSFGGNAYAIGTDAVPLVIYYNKTLIENNGLKTPREYYEEGNWNWETFRELAINMTADTDGDAVVDQYGFGWWDGDYAAFLTTNGVTNLQYNTDGTIGTSYKNEAAIEAIQFIQDAYIKDKYIDVSQGGDYFMGAFTGGKLAMTMEYGFNGFAAYASNYEVDFVPMPTGPKGTADSSLGGLSGWSLPITAANPEGAAAFATMSSAMAMEHATAANTEKYGAEATELMNKLSQNILFVPIGIEKYWDANWSVVSGIREGTPVSTFLDVADDIIAEGVKIMLEQ